MIRARGIAVGGLAVGVCCCCWGAWASRAGASVIRGIGTAALRGGDLTDPENNGDPENNVNYNATFAGSETI